MAISEITIIRDWAKHDVTLEEFGFSLTTASGKSVQLDFQESDPLRSYTGHRLTDALNARLREIASSTKSEMIGNPFMARETHQTAPLLTGFAALDATDWSKLHHAYGRATDTPEHLRALLRDDAESRKNALEHLWSAIIHQGTPWTATGPAALVVAGFYRMIELITANRFGPIC